MKTQIVNLKRNITVFEEKKATEIEILKRDIDALKIKERDAFSKLLSVEKEFDFLKDENRKLLKEKD